MNQILLIGIGGFFGSVSRFLISRYVGSLLPSFPLGTLFVNVTGSFILGFISYAVLYGRNIDPDVRNMITVGFIGAYTTMSTFAFESFRLAELSDYMHFGLNLVLNVSLCLFAIYLSKQLAIIIIK
ncbi:MAG: fluoride efflux transporter CrcB [Candidatus Levyibacteriota bacterium]